jgi:AraC-like DNA-binding protein
MIELYYDDTSYSHFLQTAARTFKAKIINGYMQLPSNVGEGIMWAKELPCGISVLYSDCKFREDMIFNRQPIHDQLFTLLFHDVTEAPEDITNKTGAFNMLKEMVLLSDARVSNKYFVPANARLRSFRIMFRKEHLTQTMDAYFVNQALEYYFSNFIAARAIEPLNFDYRVILDDVMKEKIEQPLVLNFLQNRCLLLLETFMKKIATPKPVKEKLRFSDNELLRLMKVESMLIRNYEETPPNIQYLSRVSAMSPTKLKNDFKSLYGMPIYEYYQKNRMQRAKSLLLEGDHSIKEVGNKVGYSNLSHFAGSFRKEFGVLPSQFVSSDNFA